MTARNRAMTSIITPVYNTDPQVLRECIESVRAQTYFNWELCLCDDCSTRPETIVELERYRGIDSRIKIVRSPTNLHISGASNFAAQFATGEFLGFLDHDDTLDPSALYEIAEASSRLTELDLLYTDEDKIDEAGKYCDPDFKPDWSPEHLTSVMYVLHFLVVRKSLFLKLGGFRQEYSGAQDYDLALRVSRFARQVHHIPKILYHWRKVEGSASAEVDAKPYALTAGKRALEDYVKQGITPGTVEDGLLPGFFRVRYEVAQDVPVTLLILSNDAQREVPGRGKICLLQNSLKSIAQHTKHKNYEILVIHNNDLGAASLELIASLGGRAVSFNRQTKFNYPERLNFGFEQVRTEHVITLNDDIEIITPDWIEALLEWSQQEEIGAVGARLLYPDGKVQHSGIALVPKLGATHAFYKLKRDDIGYYGMTHLVKNYSAVTAAVMATRMEVVRKVGGFDRALAIDFNDVDFCLRVQEFGYRVVCTPFCEIMHLEGSSIKRTAQNPLEVEIFQQRWGHVVERDPYINFNLIKSVYPYAIDPENP